MKSSAKGQKTLSRLKQEAPAASCRPAGLNPIRSVDETDPSKRRRTTERASERAIDQELRRNNGLNGQSESARMKLYDRPPRPAGRPVGRRACSRSVVAIVVVHHREFGADRESALSIISFFSLHCVPTKKFANSRPAISKFANAQFCPILSSCEYLS